MITLMQWLRFWFRRPNSLAMRVAAIFCLFCSPQLNMELKHGSEIVVEREPAS